MAKDLKAWYCGGSYLRLMDFVSLNLRFKDLLGPLINESKEEEEKSYRG